MVIFDKSITLIEKIREYDKESLKAYAYDLGLTKLSKLKKEELAQKITDKLLDSDIMFYRGAILSDKQISIMKKGFNGPYTYQDDEAFDVGTLNEMDFAVVSNGQFIIPCDVVELWNRVKGKRFQTYQKRASWVWKCIYWAEEMYAVTPIDIMLEVINVKNDVQMDEKELIDIFCHFPEDRLWTIFLSNIFLNRIYISEEKSLKQLRHAQADKDYYIPTEAEIEEFAATGALISSKEYQDMQYILEHDLGFDKTDASDLLLDLWGYVSSDNDPHGTMQWFWDQIKFENDKQVEKIVGLYMPIANSTRMLVNRGHKPSELHAKTGFGPGNMPVITAGSSQAAKLLQEIAPDIQKMGFELDLESNANRIPVMSFSNGLSGDAIIKEKKVYPNDPCPCGSGKKYKKCCGK